MDDKELFEQLSRGPLTRNGFDDALKKKIHERIDNPKRKATRFWNLILGRASIALSVVLIFLYGVWTWNEFNRSEHNQAAKQEGPAPAATEQAAASGLEDNTIDSAMLIGLRRDISSSEQGGPVSTYRTVLVVPVGKELSVVAEGSGIYMPFKQQFWKIIPVPNERGQGGQTLAAYPADEAGGAAPVASSSTTPVTEKLLFAGNRYVSIEQTITVSLEDGAVNESKAWVNEVKHLAPDVREGNPDVLERLHYSLSDVLGVEDKGSIIDEWAILRAQGKWVAIQPTDTVNSSDAGSMYDLNQITTPLTKQVTGPDILALHWDEITKIAPNAEDAFTSTTEDILAVVLPESIDLYPYKLSKNLMKPLKISTAPNETIIMVQWAEANYVELWRKQLSKWIPPTDTPSL